MKWFTRDWTQGRLNDAQFDLVPGDHAAHVAALRLKAPSLAALVDLNIHDGQVREWAQTGDSFRWRLLVGDLQRGYERAIVEYGGASVIGGEAALAALRLDAPDGELLYDELDESCDGKVCAPRPPLAGGGVLGVLRHGERHTNRRHARQSPLSALDRSRRWRS